MLMMRYEWKVEFVLFRAAAHYVCVDASFGTQFVSSLYPCVWVRSCGRDGSAVTSQVELA